MAVIEVEGLRKRYGETQAADGVSFSVEEGEIFGILGPNGAGKTTTVEIIEGLRDPDEGRVRVLGLDPRRDRGAVRQRLGAQLQESELPEKLRVDEAIALYRSFYRPPADGGALLERLGLTQVRRTRFADRHGKLRASREAYDKRVVGVVSGAGEHKPGIVLDKKSNGTKRAPVALVGKVYCQAHADDSPIGVGDLLTTSRIPGHAMKATNPVLAFGAVLGKALAPLDAGEGLIPILVTLQ